MRMKCVRCQDQRVIWGKDRFNYATPIPCPECNKDGKAVRTEIEIKEMELKQCNPQQP